MRILSMTLLAVLLSAPAAPAEIYRCRSNAGRLVFTDDPAHFPAGCKAEPSPSSGALNVVPLPVPAGVRGETQTLLRDADTRRQDARRQQAGWLDAARSIAADFQRAQQEYYYSSQRTQATMMAAQQAMSRAAQDKADLLQAMTAARADQETSRQVSSLLAGVEAP